jgi:hypothetical protein
LPLRENEIEPVARVERLANAPFGGTQIQASGECGE